MGLAVLRRARETGKMIKEIKTKKAPEAIGPYSQAVRAGGFLFISGAIPLLPDSGEIVGGGISAQTRCVLSNLEAVLEGAGLGPGDVVKTTVYLSDMAMFTGMNEVYGEFFSPPYPARATVEVARLPKDVLLEIEAVALAD